MLTYILTALSIDFLLSIYFTYYLIREADLHKTSTHTLLFELFPGGGKEVYGEMIEKINKWNAFEKILFERKVGIRTVVKKKN